MLRDLTKLKSLKPFENIKNIFFSGNHIKLQNQKDFFNKLPNATVINLYFTPETYGCGLSTIDLIFLTKLASVDLLYFE